MRQRQREHQDVIRHHQQTPDHTATPESTESRAAAERFLSAADEAIERALSGDSEAFLAASRQTSAQ